MVVLMIITLTNEGKLQGDFVMITMMMILMIMTMMMVMVMMMRATCRETL